MHQEVQGQRMWLSGTEYAIPRTTKKKKLSKFHLMKDVIIVYHFNTFHLSKYKLKYYYSN